jgi:ribosomal protein L24E
MRFYKHTISNHHEETECAFCGAPIYVGETVYFIEDEPTAVCSALCKRELILDYERVNGE